jgi:hypothetical protein
MNNIKEKLKHANFLLLVSIFLVSCGGANSGSGTTTAEPIDPSASKWDTMIWDLNEWE